MITAILIGVLGVFSYQNTNGIKALRVDSSAMHQQVNDQEERLNRHATAITNIYNARGGKVNAVNANSYGVPTDSWMGGL